MEGPRSNKYRKLIGLFALIVLILLPILHTSTDTSASAEESKKQINKKSSEALTQYIFQEKIGKIDSFLNIHQKRYNFQGNVLVGHKGHVIYKKTFGYANPKTRTKLDEDAVFQLASVSKQFTAASVMILQQRGLLSYDDTIQKYIPEFPYEGITIKMLLNHTSGLPNYMWLLEHRWNKKMIPYNDDVISLMNKHKLHLHFQPGTRFSYSNTGYIILASIIERVSGTTYKKFLEGNIFKPLNMKRSFVYSPAIHNNPPKKVSGYKRWGRGYRTIPNTINDGAVGDKGVYSTIKDLYKWDQALYSNKLINEKNKKKAFNQLTLKNGYHYPYGFGFRLKTIDSSKVVYHYGKWNGFRTGLVRFVEDTNTVVVLNHTNRPGISKITKNIEKILNSDKS
jgi:CubicO group peptidase (beta-lactamase class C family)